MNTLEVGKPILSGEKKFYPVIEWIPMKVLVGFRAILIYKPIEIEYFENKTEAEAYIHRLKEKADAVWDKGKE